MKDSTAIAIWSALPLIAACATAIHGNVLVALLFGGMTVTALAAAYLSRSMSGARRTIGVCLLLLLSTPFAFRLISRLALVSMRDLLRVANSPAGFVVGTVIQALLSVPPIVLALGVWRRRRAVVKLPPHA